MFPFILIGHGKSKVFITLIRLSVQFDWLTESFGPILDLYTLIPDFIATFERIDSSKNSLGNNTCYLIIVVQVQNIDLN
jgi:hypothetical protein